jgi:transcriptional regulator with XRE-family HTH domain
MTSIELSGRLEQRRRELRMSKRELSTRAHIPIATLNRILSGQEKRLAFEKVCALVAALRLVIHVGPTTTLDELESSFELRQKQAKQKAEQVVRMVQGTMGLEAQAVDSDDLKAMVEQTTCELLAGSPRKLWSE